MRKKIVVVLGFLLLQCSIFWGQSKFAWDFSDCEIKDILFAVSLDTGISIVPDDTVSGKGDFKFNGNDFETGFDAFLAECRLYAEKSEKLWTVSKVRFLESENKITFDAFDLSPNMILEKLGNRLDSILIYENLPVQKISVHYKNVEKKDLLEALGKRFGNYEIIEKDNSFSFVKKNETKLFDDNSGFARFSFDENKNIVVDVKNTGFKTAVEELFYSDCGKSVKNPYFCFTFGNDVKIERAVFSCKSFNEALEKICGLNDFSFKIFDEIYYILPDKNAKSDLVYGQKNWNKFDLKYVDCNFFINETLKGFEKNQIIEDQNKSSFFVKCTEEEKKEIQNLIGQFDVKKNCYVVNLKYVKAENLISNLQKDVLGNGSVIQNSDTSLSFTGSEENFKDFCQHLELYDKPEKKLTYDLLIMEYKESLQSSFGTNFEVNRLELGDRNGIAAQLGSVLNLNMNVVSAFGLNFAANLQTAMEKNETNIFVDTTLQGLSGKDISFQNTNTYRYRDNNLDPDTGKPIYSGVTKEIVSGIKIDINGWVSGEGLITTNVTTSISRQGTDTSSSTGNPPPTSEKVITTEVCGKSGVPIVISGLIENSDTEDFKGIPGIEKIPLFRRLFSSSDKNQEKSQMVIYLIPKIQEENLRKIEKKNNKEVLEKYKKIMAMLEAKND